MHVNEKRFRLDVNKAGQSCMQVKFTTVPKDTRMFIDLVR